MKVVFASNYLNHHVMSICNAFINKTGGNFYFIATMSISQERLDLGYEDLNNKYPWVIRSYESNDQMQKAKQLIIDADILIVGNAPYRLIKERLRKNKFTFRCSERIYKKKPKWYELPIRSVLNFYKHGRYKNLYMLSASSYTAKDYARTFTYINKCFKWGYFPEVKNYSDIDNLINSKEKGSIIWVGRFIKWKHPEYAVNLAKRLKNDGYDFKIKMIGNGEEVDEIKKMVDQYQLKENVILMGTMNHNSVRLEMEKSEIHIFTSDRNEGWGAVLNEAMNSACACVCDDAIGSSGFLIDDKINGHLYKDGDFEDFYQKVKGLLDNDDKRKKTSSNAYSTMIEEWNAANAVEKFLKLCNNYLEKGVMEFLFNDGVLSKAE